MYYKKNAEPTLAKSLFKNPTCEYRGTPFWAWNSLLTQDELNRQIDVFKKMGLGGFHMHVRTGLKNKYLSDEYMALVRGCVEKAKNEEMLAHLYDEDRWPSGAAGGLVTKDEKYRSRFLLFTPFKDAPAYGSNDASADSGRSGRGTLIACYDVVLDAEGYLASYRQIGEDEKAEGKKWYAFVDSPLPDGWYNNQTYVDTLNKEAIERFVEVTHERYAETVGDEFDKTVPSIFTDEPQLSRKGLLDNSFDETDITMPWTDNVPALYRQAYGKDIMETLPELFWDLPGSAPSVNRYLYHDFIAELFASSFADTIGTWCAGHNIKLTGHMMEEPALWSQSKSLGEAMRSYRSFQMPGIDMLCNRCELTTAKQAQSAVHQYGYEGMLSELYGVTGWDCDFRTYKYQGDWQAALGVTVRVPHLSWYAMGGEAKRDYPASISYQSPWCEKYRVVEDHFARVNTALTRGKPVIRVAVIHPVESFWLHWGPNDKSALLRETLDANFKNVTQWLLEGSIDFNFISESLFPSQCEKGGFPLQVGQMTYDAVVVPGCETLRSTTLERLDAFRKAGGKLIFMGNAPVLLDAQPSEECKKLFAFSECIDFSRGALLTALNDCRTVTIRWANGKLTDNLLYQMRQDNDCRWLFVCHDREPHNKDVDNGGDLRITVAGKYAVELYDTADGTVVPVSVSYRNGNTVIARRMYGYDSFLFRLTEGEQICDTAARTFCEEGTPVADPCAYSASEDNILVLDKAGYKLSGDTAFSPEEEILRLDNIARTRLGLRERDGGVAQPWVTGDIPTVDTITLRFVFESEIGYTGAFLALEDAENAAVTFNGEPVDTHTDTYYVDIDIDRLALPEIRKGENELIISYPYGVTTNIENVFVTGDFGVRINGTKAVITEKPTAIGFGDLTQQGFPFYSGNMTYRFRAKSENGKLILRASYYRGAMISVKVDGKEAGDIVYPPYVLEADCPEDGEHDIEMTLYIHRYNSFGPIHLVDEKEDWHGPGAWRSEGCNWTYNYVLRRTGILGAPCILKK